jgi:hypothetical protein
LATLEPSAPSTSGTCAYVGAGSESSRASKICRGVESTRSAPRTTSPMPCAASSTTTRADTPGPRRLAGRRSRRRHRPADRAAGPRTRPTHPRRSGARRMAVRPPSGPTARPWTAGGSCPDKSPRAAPSGGRRPPRGSPPGCRSTGTGGHRRQASRALPRRATSAPIGGRPCRPSRSRASAGRRAASARTRGASAEDRGPRPEPGIGPTGSVRTTTPPAQSAGCRDEPAGGGRGKAPVGRHRRGIQAAHRRRRRRRIAGRIVGADGGDAG